MLEVLQIIWEVIFREPDPNTVQFIEPITAALLAGSAIASGVGKIIQGRQARKAADAQAELDRQAAEAAQAEADTQIADALGRQAEFGLAPTYNELRKTVMEDPAADLQRQEALRSEAEQVQALKTGGARALLGGLSKVDASTADRFAKIAADESARRKSGLQTIAGAEQQVESMKYQQAGKDLASARALREEALGAAAGADALEVRGQLAQSQGLTEGIAGSISEGLGYAAELSGESEEGGRVYTQEEIDEMERNIANLEGGGFVRGENRMAGGMLSFEEGAQLMRGMSPGEFNHDTNPIDIVRDGMKIGELTGGEGVVAPKELGAWEQESVKGDTKMHKMMRAWFKKIKKKQNV